MQRCRYVDIRTPRLTDVRQSRLDGIVCPKLMAGTSTLMTRCLNRSGVAHTASISTTVRKAFSETPDIGARKLPAAPNIQMKEDSFQHGSPVSGLTGDYSDRPQITKSIRPKTSMHFLAAALRVSGLRTSTEAKTHLRPVASASSLAAASPLSCLSVEMVRGQPTTWGRLAQRTFDQG